ncbi:MAG: RnfABCDGE type electron transport complex subunit D [Paludibacter sp.]|nr:RnfABCDGE type electron transport complex subunit D [Paludibacter sp.]
MDKLIISPAPHVHSGNSISKNMQAVIIALMPAYLVALYYFGLGALIVSLTAIISCVLFEYLIQKYILKGENTIKDGSAALTGLLLAFNLPSNIPVYIVIVGSLVAIGVAKMSFGGLGNNPFNPALVARVFLLISFPVAMTSWPVPEALSTHYLDAITAPTTLRNMNFGVQPDTLQLLIGNIGGSMGEVSGLALLLGFVYLLYKKVITWHIPISILATVALFIYILHLAAPQSYIVSPLDYLLSGGLLLGAIYMATDYVTSPMTKKGMLIYGVGIGLLTVIIRISPVYPEGVSFAILIMNAFTPLINTYIKPKRFGEVVKNKK